jgi:hypothetical protein
MIARRSFLGAGTLALVGPADAAEDEVGIRPLRSGGVILLMRHARTTPGVGDPPGFRLDDCSTQRNLSDAGRQQARRWGDWLRENDVEVARLLTSAWCRCQETAALLGFGDPETFHPLNSFFDDRSGANASREGIHRFVEGWRGPGVAVLVTHQVNITGAYGVVPAMGEALVIAPGERGGRVLVRVPQPG